MRREENIQKIHNLISTAQEENIELAFQLAKSQHIDEDEIKSYWLELMEFESSEYLSRWRTLKLSFKESLKMVLNRHELEFVRSGPVAIPDSIQYLRKLESIILVDGSLKSIPAAIGKIKSLKKICFSSNDTIKEVPRALSQLPALEELDLEANSIETLPDAFSNLTGLKRLYLSDNNFKEVPGCIASLTNLEVLYLRSNLIRAIPDSLAQLTKLKNLDLSALPLEDFPSVVTRLTSLENLDFWSSTIRTVPESIGELVQLKRLVLQYTHIKSLPESISRLTNLKDIYLRGLLFTPEEKEKTERMLPHCNVVWK